MEKNNYVQRRDLLFPINYATKIKGKANNSLRSKFLFNIFLSYEILPRRKSLAKFQEMKHA